GDKRTELCNAALDQPSVKDAAAVIVFSAVYKRTTGKYREKGIRYVHIEVGHAAQNIYLQAVSLNLGTVVIGAFDDEEVKKIMNIGDKEQPLYIMPVGKE
ncbi:MAG: SagB/ThcOx family dehydrogenase, partial [Nitrospirae bacterium]|nr:SagB/ThcOx family dehydrogenase [Nitrospirota bacterium]